MSAIEWQKEAEEGLARVPFLLRPLVRRKVEELVTQAGGSLVTAQDFARAEEKYRALKGGRSDQELAAMLPAENRPGTPLVVVEACRHELAGCPNALLNLEPWRRAVEEWLARDNVSERLRAKVADDKILFHHKLRIALSGCPNGCSRPQIADLALVGTVHPQFDAAACTACGACAEACPDGAIQVADTALWSAAACQGCRTCHTTCPAEAVTLDPPGARILLAGKLGRHPHLAAEVAQVATPAEAVAVLREAVEAYLAEGQPGERFAAWWLRTRGR
ncbi:MAG: 4Fe-4S binding protein [Deltaproteobacteria bacterium]|nr:4Fe-4S binding protein [Deltaproteobacteria bacterium]MCB2186299.1 4Fe-4S binding protein [Deltaproteobacteria bacterium]